MLFLFRKRRRTLEELEEVRSGRAAGIRAVITVLGIIFLVLVTFLVSMLALTPMLELQALRQQKKRVEELLILKRKEEKEAHDRFRWTADPEYFEQLARDRANMALEGETVIRRPEKNDTPPPAPQPRRD
ncbi:MAG: septum formation initiator family protein [Akkermansia sp.]|nr:septum formation initiator family protein [Akkermansia sp.]